MDCPLNGLCLASSILYQATIKCSDSKYKPKRYKEICETNVMQTTKNHSTYLTLKMTPPYIYHTGS